MCTSEIPWDIQISKSSYHYSCCCPTWSDTSAWHTPCRKPSATWRAGPRRSQRSSQADSWSLSCLVVIGRRLYRIAWKLSAHQLACCACRLISAITLGAISRRCKSSANSFSPRLPFAPGHQWRLRNYLLLNCCHQFQFRNFMSNRHYRERIFCS